MKIAIYCSPAYPVPPPAGKILAPWVLAGQIADSLVKRGHTVDLYAAKGSKTLAKVVDNSIDSSRFYQHGEDPRQIRFFDSQLAATLYRKQQLERCYDIIHVHHPIHRTLPFTQFVDIPTLITLHNTMSDSYVYQAAKQMSNVYLTPISHSQAKTYPGLPYTKVVYNGIEVEEYKFSSNDWGYLLATGRIVPEKGFHTAIEIAKQTDHKLIIAGEFLRGDNPAARYWKEQIEPHIDNKQILYAGTMSKAELVKLYQHAKALLFPIEWEEPFGLVMTEAMACGTPVIAYRRGSVPEVVIDGKTGFIVDTQEEMERAVASVAQINRVDCRKHVEKNFSLKAMVDGYEQVYSALLSKK